MRLRAATPAFLLTVVTFLIVSALAPLALAQSAAEAHVAAIPLSELPSFASVGSSTAPLPASPPLASIRRGPSPRRRRAWVLLAAAQHGAALFDAQTTRDAMNRHRELDPLIRPFAHSAALYPVMQIAPAGLDWFALRLASSRHRWLRCLWWLPQSAAAAGFLWSGAHNLTLPDIPPR